MSLPTTTSAWVITQRHGGLDSLQFRADVPLPALGPNDVLVRLRAVSLNFRDLAIPSGWYPDTMPVKANVIAASDGAGDILATGAGVTEFRRGDKVATVFHTRNPSGSLTPATRHHALGGPVDGVLASYAVLPATAVVRLGAGWTYADGAALPCAGVTAWNALFGGKRLRAGQSVLVQGSGGVSVFALQFAKAAGAFVAATTSSDEKAARLRELGADVVLNYRTTPEWGAAAKAASPGGEGYDHVVEIGGPNTLAQSYAAVKIDGVVSLIGYRAGGGPDEKVASGFEPLTFQCASRGVYVGSRAQMQEMVGVMEVNSVRPVLDSKRFRYRDAKRAFEYLAEGAHFGKVVIDFDEGEE